jgi:hypothetical protein
MEAATTGFYAQLPEGKRSFPVSQSQLIEKAADERSDLVGRLIQGEMPRLQEVDLCIGHIAPIGRRSGHGERRGALLGPASR